MRVVGRALNNFSPSDIFRKMLLLEECHQVSLAERDFYRQQWWLTLVHPERMIKYTKFKEIENFNPLIHVASQKILYYFGDILVFAKYIFRKNI